MSFSHSSLKQFRTCARQYYEVRVLKNYPREETEATLYGTELHAAAEGYLLNKVIDPRFAFMVPILDAFLSKKGRVHAEVEMAVTKELVPCAWDSTQAWCRGIADLLMVDGDKAVVTDWKSGSDKYPDKDQLDLMSLLTFAYYPEVNTVNSALVFVLKNNIVKHKVVRSQAEKLWWEYRERVAAIDQAHESGVWNPTQSGLCRRHCVVTSCEMNGNHFNKGA